MSKIQFKYQESTMLHNSNRGRKFFLKYAREASNTFCLRKEVKKYIYERDGFKCLICGTGKNLSIDHILPVYQVTSETFPYLNSLENLRTLCISCNSKRSPECQDR